MHKSHPDNTPIVDGISMERLMLAIGESLKILRRFQFFLWSQGALQGVLPHEKMICVFGDFSTLRFKYDVFSCAPVDPDLIGAFTDPVDGVLKRLIGHWLSSQRSACFFEAGDDVVDSLAGKLRSLGCGNVLAHGAKEITGGNGSFFVLLGTPEKLRSKQIHLIEMLMPHLHMALYRMLPNEAEIETILLAPESVLSGREQEVLHWVREGKTNHEIGQKLRISPLTVKNHVQNILKKLRVNNRAQAVAKSETSSFLAVDAQG